MLEPFDLVVRGGTVVGAGQTRRLDIGIRDGRFEAVADPGVLEASATEVFDATGLQVLPGVIDGHVHFREPGLEQKGDWLSELRAAVMGGVTTVLEMPNTVPPTRDLLAAQQKAALAGAKSYCDFGFFGLVDSEFDAGVLAELVSSGLVVGLKVFLGPTTGGLSAPDDNQLLQALAIARDAGIRVGFHAEDREVIRLAESMVGNMYDATVHLDSRPAHAEEIAIDHAARLLEQTGAKGHIFHLSSADGLAALERWRARGLDLTTEVTAHHCFLGRDDYARLGGQMKVNPPVRGEPHSSALLQALADGRIDCIASDHAPHMPGEKLSDMADASAGIAGVETTLPLFMNAVSDGRLTLERLADATSAAPARVWNLAGKGKLAAGADGDLTLVELGREHTIQAAELHGKHQITPFDGTKTVGWPVATIVRGRVVMREGELSRESGTGRIVSREVVSSG